MRIVELADLPTALRPQLATLSWLDGDYPQDESFLRRLRRLGFPYSDYQALFAIEGDQVLGKVETIVLPFVTASGTQPVLGVTGVSTRPDALERGIATILLEQAHARERHSDRKWAFLWTHRSWGAHRLYERLGYRDVYSPPAALRRIPPSARRPVPNGYGWETLKTAEVPFLDRVLHAGSRERHGFIPRFPGSFRLRFQMGWRHLSEYNLLRKGSVPVGYAFATSNPAAIAAYEVVVTAARHSVPMVAALERRAAGRWLVFGHTTFVRDHEELLRGRGYALYREGHATLMAKPLGPSTRRARSSDPLEVCRGPAFACHRGDVF
ncbi:MAG: GNAT family N-acetyltransferase [Thermoplasmata archaeon]|nr:GNAT family N-acetyltransferase [Thermoplasmata archaeon]